MCIVKYKFTAIPSESNPSPIFAEVAGTLIVNAIMLPPRLDK